MSAYFLSLPAAIYTNIWDYCDAKDIMALASTCRMLNTEIERCMLVVDAQYDWDSSQQIPVFFADQCHSSFVTCERYIYNSFDIWSRKRQPTGSSARDCVWDAAEIKRKSREDIAFRTDPTREYTIDTNYSNDYQSAVLLRKQFMTSPVTPAMKQALSVCLSMGHESEAWYPIERNLSKAELTRFFMKLFLLGCGSLSDESSPIRVCFKSGETSTAMDNTSICLIPVIINLCEQTLEQKEPMHCVKRTLLAKAMQRDSRTRTGCDKIPELRLVQEFTWKSSKRKHLDREDSKRCNDELVFIARIPLARNTTRISLTANTKTDSSKLLFVIFFQRRQDSLESMKNLIDGKVFHGDGAFRFGRTYFVETDHDACFLYFVPGDATKMEMTRLNVRFDVVLDKLGEGLCHWMQVLVHGSCWIRSHRLLPVMLLREGALSLLGPNQKQNTEWKDAFDMIRLDWTPEVLECVVDVCNVLLQELSS